MSFWLEHKSKLAKNKVHGRGAGVMICLYVIYRRETSCTWKPKQNMYFLHWSQYTWTIICAKVYTGILSRSSAFLEPHPWIQWKWMWRLPKLILGVFLCGYSPIEYHVLLFMQNIHKKCLYTHLITQQEKSTHLFLGRITTLSNII